MTNFFKNNIAELLILLGVVLLGVSVFQIAGIYALLGYFGLIFIITGGVLTWSELNNGNN